MTRTPIAVLIVAAGMLGGCILDSAGAETAGAAQGGAGPGAGGSGGAGGGGGTGGSAGTCGDGALTDEACDDGNADPGDGCSERCAVEPGFSCNGAPSACAPICGDELLSGAEACDDGDTDPGDGCGADCAVEAGFICSGAPSICTFCGDGSIGGTEQCEDGDLQGGDGCSATCMLEAMCGNGVIEPGETCDDTNTDGGDDCGASCQLEAGTSCADAVDLNAPSPEITVAGTLTTYLGSTTASPLVNFDTPICANLMSPDVPTVVHQYTIGPWPAALEMTTVDVGGELNDTVLRAYVDCLDPSVEIACNDDITVVNLYSSASTPILPAGTTVFIVVSGLTAADVGPYRLEVMEARLMLLELFSEGLGLFEVTDVGDDGQSWEWCGADCLLTLPNPTQSTSMGPYAAIFDDAGAALDHEVLRTPTLNAEGLTSVFLGFAQEFDEKGGLMDTATIELSTDLQTWSEVTTYTATQTGGTVLDISTLAAGAPSFVIRFVYDDYDGDADDWRIDDVFVYGY